MSSEVITRSAQSAADRVGHRRVWICACLVVLSVTLLFSAFLVEYARGREEMSQLRSQVATASHTGRELAEQVRYLGERGSVDTGPELVSGWGWTDPAGVRYECARLHGSYYECTATTIPKVEDK